MSGRVYLWDTCVVRRFIVEAPGDDYVERILRHLEDAEKKKTKLHFSSVIFAEGQLAGTKAGAQNKLESDLRKLGNVIDPIPDIMKMSGRLRSLNYDQIPEPAIVTGATRTLSLGDAINLSTAIWLRDVMGEKEIAFHTFDDGKTKTNGVRFTPLISFHKWCHGIESHPDVAKIIALKRVKPNHPDLPVLA
jgi:hypothetical protein